MNIVIKLTVVFLTILFIVGYRQTQVAASPLQCLYTNECDIRLVSTVLLVSLVNYLKPLRSILLTSPSSLLSITHRHSLSLIVLSLLLILPIQVGDDRLVRCNYPCVSPLITRSTQSLFALVAKQLRLLMHPHHNQFVVADPRSAVSAKSIRKMPDLSAAATNFAWIAPTRFKRWMDAAPNAKEEERILIFREFKIH